MRNWLVSLLCIITIHFSSSTIANDNNVLINIGGRSTELGVSNVFKALDHSVFILPVPIAVSKVYPHALELVERHENEVIKYRRTEEYKSILTRYGFVPELLTKGGSL